MKFEYWLPFILLFTICIPVSGAELVSSPSGVLNLETGREGSLSLTLTGATAGISGFNITYTLSDASVSSVTGFSFPDWVKLPKTSPSGSLTGYAMGVDLEKGMEPGIDPITLFTIDYITGDKEGQALLTLTPIMIDDDRKGRYSLAPLSITIQVGEPQSLTTPTQVFHSTSYTGSGSSGSGAVAGGAPIATTSRLEDNPADLLIDYPGEIPPTQLAPETVAEPDLISGGIAQETESPVVTTPLSWSLSLAGISLLVYFRGRKHQNPNQNEVKI